MPISEYYSKRSDEEIDNMIKSLSPFQKRFYDKTLTEYGDKRRAVFVATCYPPDEKDMR